MAKSKLTLELEDKLRTMSIRRRIYGCEEVTIGFYKDGHGDEIVDFCTMDSNGIIRCYEIKISMKDLKSKAKKSWYGHFNYLFIPEELYIQIKDNLDDYIPNYVGVAVPCYISWSDGVEIKRKPKRQNISSDQENMMKESMIRSMSYKLIKYRNSSDLERVKTLNSRINKLEKENKQYAKDIANCNWMISYLERILRVCYNFRFDLAEFVDKISNRQMKLTDINLQLTESGHNYNEMMKGN